MTVPRMAALFVIVLGAMGVRGLFVPLARGDEPGRRSGQAAETDLDRLQGIWKLESIENQGQTMRARESQPPTTLAYDQGRFQIRQGDRLVSEGTVKLDPTRSPRACEHTHTAGPSKGKTFLGIYKVDGPRLVFCWAPPGGPRPVDFSTSQDNRQTVNRYRRVPLVLAPGS